MNVAANDSRSTANGVHRGTAEGWFDRALEAATAAMARGDVRAVLEHLTHAEDLARKWRAQNAGEVAADGPTADDPLRGLDKLARVTLMGRDRILAKAAEPVPYVWQDIAVLATIIVLAGGPSEGKTTLLFLILAARMNLGEPVELLGRVVTPAPAGQRVVLIEGEHGEASASRKLVGSLAMLGIDDAALSRVMLIARKAVRIGSPEWDEIVMLCREGLVSDIALDTLARVAPADANDETEQVAIFDRVAQAIEAAPEGKTPTVWVAAHTRKPKDGEEGGGGLASVSGSAQRTGQADSVLMVKGEKVGGQTVSSTVTCAKLREEPDAYPEPVKFAIVKGLDGRKRLEVDIAAPKDDRPLEVRIVALLTIAPRTKNQLAAALGRSARDIDDAISNLFATRTITATNTKKRGKPCKEFALRADRSPADDEAA